MRNVGLSTTNLKKSFGDLVALDEVNLSVEKGRIVGLLGQNGAGKSTLVRLLSGVMKPNAGSATVNGYDLSKNPLEVKRSTGLLPEEYALYEKLSIWEYVEFLGTLYDMDEDEIWKRFETISRRLELYTLKNRLIETLSKGQKQKVALIAAIIHEPKILFLDEPLANLDVKAQRIVRDIIKEYKSKDRIILIATHLLLNVQQTCDDVVIIDQGKIKYTGSLKDFQANFDDLEEAYLSFIEVEV